MAQKLQGHLTIVGIDSVIAEIEAEIDAYVKERRAEIDSLRSTRAIIARRGDDTEQTALAEDITDLPWDAETLIRCLEVRTLYQRLVILAEDNEGQVILRDATNYLFANSLTTGTWNSLYTGVLDKLNGRKDTFTKTGRGSYVLVAESGQDTGLEE